MRVRIQREVLGCKRTSFALCSSIWHRQVRRKRRIRTLPNTRPRIVIPRPKVVELRLLIELLAREEVRQLLRILVLGNPSLPEREILHVLVQLPARIRHVLRRAEMIRVVEENEIVLRQIRRHLVARVMRILDRLLPVPGLLRPRPERRPEEIPRIHVGCPRHDLRRDPRLPHEHMLRPDALVPYGPKLIDVRSLALLRPLDHALPSVVVLVVRGPPVIVDLLDPILLVPDDDALLPAR